MGKSEQSNSFFIYFAVLSTDIIAFVTGSCFSWTSPILPKFNSTNPDINPLGRPTTIFETSWIVSGMSLGLIFGPPLTIFCRKFFTKKTVLLVVATPAVAAHVICIFADEVSWFILARFLMGVASGSVWTVLGTYVAEIAEDSNRGFLGGLAGLMSNLGSLFVYSVGPYVSIRMFSIMNLVPLGLYYLFFGFCVSDSPYDLLIQKKELKAKLSLIKLRKRLEVDKELCFIDETIRMDMNNDFHMMDLFKNKALFKAFGISVMLMVFQQLSGILAVVSYAQTIFQLAGDFIPSAISAIVIGAISTVASIMCPLLIDRMGRKRLFALSCTFACVSLFALGSYFLMLDNGHNVSSWSWLPVSSLCSFTFAFNFGLCILPWVVMGEVLPSYAKSVASTLASLSNFVLSFVVTMCFPYMVVSLGMAGTFYTFGVFMVLGTVYSLIFLPETKGKNFQEIQKMLS